MSEQGASDLHWYCAWSFLVPVVLLAAALIFAFRFPLSPDVHERLRPVLEVRRSGEPESDEMRQEAESLSQLLIGG